MHHPSLSERLLCSWINCCSKAFSWPVSSLFLRSSPPAYRLGRECVWMEIWGSKHRWLSYAVLQRDGGRSLGCQGWWYLRHRLLAHEYKAWRGNTCLTLSLSLSPSMHVWMNWSRFSNMRLASGHRETRIFLIPSLSCTPSSFWFKKSSSWHLMQTPPPCNLPPPPTSHPLLHSLNSPPPLPQLPSQPPLLILQLQVATWDVTAAAVTTQASS